MTYQMHQNNFLLHLPLVGEKEGKMGKEKIMALANNQCRIVLTTVPAPLTDALN